MRLRVIGVLAAVAFAVAAHSPARSQAPCADGMTFILSPGGEVVAQGRICPETSELFRYFLQRQGRFGRDWPVTVRLASLGGNPAAAMTIGRLLRQHRMSVEIVGPCASACTFLAMGGVSRTISPEGGVGVHRMAIVPNSSSGLTPEQALAFGQQFAAIVSEYAAEMGVSSGFVHETLRTPNEQMTVLTPEQLCRYNFLTCGEPQRAEPRAEGGPLLPVTFWSLNQSLMALSITGDAYEFYYHQPRTNLAAVGVEPGTLFVTGRRIGQAFVGTAYTFSRHCGPIAYRVQGTFNPSGTELVLTGEAPMVDAQCRVGRTEIRRIELVATPPPSQ